MGASSSNASSSNPNRRAEWGNMWDEHHKTPDKLAKAAGISQGLMSAAAPTSRDDFIEKMETHYYTEMSAAATGDDQLPNCVGLALTVQIRSGLHAKFRKEVTLEAVLAAIYCACPEMLDGGIQPSKAIEMCNAANSGRGLLIPGATHNTAYFAKLAPTSFGHREFGQAFTAVQRTAKLECPPLAVMVTPSQTPPLHAMVAVGAGFLPGNRGAAISAVDIQGPSEADITADAFHQLIVCDINACEQSGRGNPSPLSAEAGFQRDFNSALESSRRATKVSRPFSCSFTPGCFQAQKGGQFDVLQDSIQNVQKSFEDKRERFDQFFQACEAEVLQAHGQVVARVSSVVSPNPHQESPAPYPEGAQAQDAIVAAQSLVSSLSDQVEARGSLRSEVSALSQISLSLSRPEELKQMVDQSRQRLAEKLDEIVSRFDFDADTQQVFSAGADDILKSLARKRGWKWCR